MTTEFVHCLWVGGELPMLARMSLRSFLKFDMQPVLWTYEPLEVPPGVAVVTDAKAILSKEELDQYTFQPTGQVALASDRFAWKVLNSHGGWYSDLDVTLLRPLTDFSSHPYVFGPHHGGGPSLALMKAPMNSRLLSRCIKRSSSIQHPTDWNIMMRIMKGEVRYLQLQQAIAPDLLPDDGDEAPLRELFKTGSSLPEAWRDLYALHWCASGTIRGVLVEEGSYVARLEQEIMAA